MHIVFATANKNKIYEVTKIIRGGIKVASLSDIGCEEELPETMPTLEGNAMQKARFVHDKYGKDCFADDTGLEIYALNGRPGVLSARYAGEGKNADDNIRQVLAEMKRIDERNARFRTVIALIHSGKEYFFEGKVEGKILLEKKGVSGFGYDPIFAPITSDPHSGRISFAEMTIEAKNLISHRANAIRKLVDFINTFL